ncbi:hypothetical protein ACOSQ4_014082 [Xanthoceras sorbifolium]
MVNEFELLCVFLWCIWLGRNKWVHSCALSSAAEVSEWGRSLLSDFQAGVALPKQVSKLVRPNVSFWQPPQMDCYKMNVDAAIDDENDHPPLVLFGLL